MRVHVQQACTCVTSVGIQRQRETNSMGGNHTGVLPSAYVLRVLARSQVWGLHLAGSIKAMQEKVDEGPTWRGSLVVGR